MPRHHAIDYVEFSVLDLAQAKAFYQSAFGWTFTDYEPATPASSARIVAVRATWQPASATGATRANGP